MKRIKVRFTGKLIRYRKSWQAEYESKERQRNGNKNIFDETYDVAFARGYSVDVTKKENHC